MSKNEERLSVVDGGALVVEHVVPKPGTFTQVRCPNRSEHRFWTDLNRDSGDLNSPSWHLNSQSGGLERRDNARQARVQHVAVGDLPGMPQE